jgi:UDP-glucose 4-epimerase
MSTKPIAIVTGGAGFIGSHMLDLLVERGYCVRVIDSLVGGREANMAQHVGNPEVTLDTRDLRTIEGKDAVFRNAELMFHFAGIGDIVPSIDNPSEYLSANVQGTVHALEGARMAQIKRFVYAASSSCYGANPELPTTEQATIVPQYPYALSKFMGEQACLHWHSVYRLPVNCIRIFNAYGPRSRTSGAYGAVFGVFLKQKLAGKPFTVVGDGNQRRDFIYVTDLARAFYAAGTSAAVGEIFNVGAGKPQTVNYLVELLKAPGVEHLPKRPGEPEVTWADISKIQRMLAWEPKVSFEEGVQNMLANIQYWKDAPLWNKNSIAEATAGWFKALA